MKAITFEMVQEWLGQEEEFQGENAINTLVEIASGEYPVETFKKDVREYANDLEVKE